MNQLDLLLKVADVLEGLNIPYMLTGALAVDYYGKPRLTQ